MSDLLLLGLIGGLTLLLLLTLLAFAGYSGLLAGVAVSAGSPPILNITVAYKFHMGPYGETGRLFTESCSISPKLRSIAVYYDNPHMTNPASPAPCGCLAVLITHGESELANVASCYIMGLCCPQLDGLAVLLRVLQPLILSHAKPSI
ncbi:hypothetical protein P7K49_030496 [Saguinus oedipus]|uniref:Testis expressed 264, ER-phagy receptor n=1 Tax=Saguinus oedipus TaxID=9490 RepID=A0ABQ9U2B2_SAGOE|nr:hypothetical protein P7K49_030496 [Saguinus oedipus]